MPLPSGQISFHGGCNCHAIRYTIDVPVLEKRPFHPWSTSHDATDAKACRLPFTTWDHCNDCRKATGALWPAWICVPADMITVTCVVADSLLEPSEQERHYSNAGITVPTGRFPVSRRGGFNTIAGKITRPGLDLFVPPFSGISPDTQTWIRYYGSSGPCTRSFCGRCGTNLTYNYHPMPGAGWPEMIDVLLGSIDREDLEKVDLNGIGILEPERQLWWGRGLPWLREAVFDLKGPKHEGPAPDKEVEISKSEPEVSDED